MKMLYGPCLRVLVAYYSYTGNTRAVAQMIRERTCGVLFGVETYEQYKPCTVDAVTRHQCEGELCPTLKYTVPPMRHYDVILVGGPVWHGCLPAPLRTFLHNVDFDGRQVAPFCTHEFDASGFFFDFARRARNAKLLQGIAVNIARHESIHEAGLSIDSRLAGLGIPGLRPAPSFQERI